MRLPAAPTCSRTRAARAQRVLGNPKGDAPRLPRQGESTGSTQELLGCRAPLRVGAHRDRGRQGRRRRPFPIRPLPPRAPSSELRALPYRSRLPLPPLLPDAKPSEDLVGKVRNDALSGYSSEGDDGCAEILGDQFI